MSVSPSPSLCYPFLPLLTQLTVLMASVQAGLKNESYVLLLVSFLGEWVVWVGEELACDGHVTVM